ncbi:MAG: FtsK/SpoIIIE domain-containing protein, partial [Muribaculum sp.]|nr:FtsK/SpoIIIE domain-containing protein [Muribaculum sp.]
MWNKLKQIFISRDDSTPQATEIENQDNQNSQHEVADDLKIGSLQEVVHSHIIEEQPSVNEYGLPLADAISRIIHEHGKTFMMNSVALNALSDYGAFNTNRAYHPICKLLVTEGIYSELISLSEKENLHNKLENWSQILVSKYGIDKTLLVSLLNEFLLGLGLITKDDFQKSISVSPKANVNHADSKNDTDTSVIHTPYNPNAGSANYNIPSIDVFTSEFQPNFDNDILEEGRKRIEWVFASQGIPVKKITAHAGPRTSLYELEIDVKKVGRVARMEKELLAALGSVGCRILNPIPGKFAIGVELPNSDNLCHCELKDIFNDEVFQKSNYSLPIALGFDSSGEASIKDLTRLSHTLICGEMGQGKTSLVRQILTSVLLKKTPEEVKFILFDGNGLEISEFNKLGRYFTAQLSDNNDIVISDANIATAVLNALIRDIEERRKLFQMAGVRSVEEYNSLFCERKLNPSEGHRYLPYIIVVCDEFTTLRTNGIKAFETLISTLLEKAASAGVYCILTTKYTTSDILTPIVRNSFPTKIGLRVHLPNESKLVVGNNLATQLLSNGDFLLLNEVKIERLQSPQCDAEDIMELLKQIENQNLPDYPYLLPEAEDFLSIPPVSLSDRDPLFEEVARYIVLQQMASTSAIQRRYCIGYNRAGKILDQLEAAGIIGPALGAKPRSILVDAISLNKILNAMTL